MQKGSSCSSGYSSDQSFDTCSPNLNVSFIPCPAKTSNYAVTRKEKISLLRDCCTAPIFQFILDCLADPDMDHLVFWNKKKGPYDFNVKTGKFADEWNRKYGLNDSFVKLSRTIQIIENSYVSNQRLLERTKTGAYRFFPDYKGNGLPLRRIHRSRANDHHAQPNMLDVPSSFPQPATLGGATPTKQLNESTKNLNASSNKYAGSTHQFIGATQPSSVSTQQSSGSTHKFVGPTQQAPIPTGHIPSWSFANFGTPFAPMPLPSAPQHALMPTSLLPFPFPVAFDYNVFSLYNSMHMMQQQLIQHQHFVQMSAPSPVILTSHSRELASSPSPTTQMGCGSSAERVPRDTISSKLPATAPSSPGSQFGPLPDPGSLVCIEYGRQPSRQIELS